MNYFTLDLDTTGPRIAIYSPRYAIKSSILEFTVEYDDEVDLSFQEIYFISPDKTEHKLTLVESGGFFTGKINLNQFPVGTARIRAQLRDEVYNLSNVAETTFEIVVGSKVVIETSASDRYIEVSNSSRYIETNIRDRNVVVKTS